MRPVIADLSWMVATSFTLPSSTTASLSPTWARGERGRSVAAVAGQGEVDVGTAILVASGIGRAQIAPLTAETRLMSQ